ncbi:hypothetical protein [Tardibacter chloracetimidivorans]|uniref:hypothetical protein n=1 Tax=Tardibacter chloracetimidivorans TaxID=1921510 RepID=UPI0009FA4555|nr:hypothetical protein [Tardibacter chloracetimidivorans]
MSKLWIIGAAGRQGAAVAEAMSVAKTPMVRVDRDRSALERLCNTIGGGAEMIVTDSMEETIAEVRRGEPSVVANFVGPFTKTALPLIAASGGPDYLDLANELSAVQSILALHDEARANDRCIVASAGFGLLATESLVLKICDDRPPAQSVRVDAIPYLADAGDRLGPAVAETIVELLRYGGRRYNRNNLERVRLGSDSERFALPDGKIVRTGAMPTGDLEAARRASNANTVLSASSAAPHGAAVPVVVPLMASSQSGFFETGSNDASRGPLPATSKAARTPTRGRARKSRGATARCSKLGCALATPDCSQRAWQAPSRSGCTARSAPPALIRQARSSVPISRLRLAVFLSRPHEHGFAHARHGEREAGCSDWPPVYRSRRSEGQ